MWLQTQAFCSKFTGYYIKVNKGGITLEQEDNLMFAWIPIPYGKFVVFLFFFFKFQTSSLLS
jgi:hypothetical protein